MHVYVWVKKHNTSLGLFVTWTIKTRLVDQQAETCIVFDPTHTRAAAAAVFKSPFKIKIKSLRAL